MGSVCINGVVRPSAGERPLRHRHATAASARAWAGLLLMAVVGAMGAARLAHAQDRFPARPLTLVVPLAAGTTIDIIGRSYAEKLTERLGQSVVVQNRPGAGGTIAAQSVAKAAADGYTVLIVNSQHSINPALYASLPYDTVRDFAAVAGIGEAPSIIAVHPRLGVKTVPEFIALARQKPGTINYGSAGVGTTTHLGGAFFASRAGVELVHVPYKGAELMPDLLSGRIEAIFVPVPFVLQQIREGRLVPLAVTTRQALRVPLEVPSVADAALPGFEYSTYYGFVAPAKTPPALLAQLSREIQAVTEDRDTRARFEAQAFFGRHVPAAEFDALIRAELERIGPIVRATGAKAN